MKYTIQHENLGEMTYEESLWTGKKRLSVNGQELKKIARNTFQTSDGQSIKLKGSFLFGTKAITETETIVLVPPCKWYEYALSLLPFILVLTWGNSKALCRLVPIVGGAIGGLIGGLFLAFDLVVIRCIKYRFLKILLLIGTTGICFLVCYLIARVILALS